jgi:hypothetical protein
MKVAVGLAFSLACSVSHALMTSDDVSMYDENIACETDTSPQGAIARLEKGSGLRAMQNSVNNDYSFVVEPTYGQRHTLNIWITEGYDQEFLRTTYTACFDRRLQ